MIEDKRLDELLLEFEPNTAFDYVFIRKSELVALLREIQLRRKADAYTRQPSITDLPRSDRH